VDGQQPGEKVRVRREHTHNAIAELGLIVKQQEQPPHQHGTPHETPMRSLIFP
jgi:hypothetical protein